MANKLVHKREYFLEHFYNLTSRKIDSLYYKKEVHKLSEGKVEVLSVFNIEHLVGISKNLAVLERLNKIKAFNGVEELKKIPSKRILKPQKYNLFGIKFIVNQPVCSEKLMLMFLIAYKNKNIIPKIKLTLKCLEYIKERMVK